DAGTVEILAVVEDRAGDARPLDQIVHAVQAPEERRLAAATRSDDRGDPVAVRGEGDVLHRDEVAVAHGDSAQIEDGVRRLRVAHPLLPPVVTALGTTSKRQPEAHRALDRRSVTSLAMKVMRS